MRLMQVPLCRRLRRIARRLAQHPLAVLAAAALVALSPLRLPGYPATADVPAHYFRTVQLELLWQRGVLFSRWAPDLMQGLGYPLFSFVPPLPYLLMAGLDVVLPGGPEVALKAFVVLVLGGLGLGTYLLVAHWAGPVGGLAAGALAIFAPSVLRDVYVQGNLPQLLAIALLPWGLWAVEDPRLRRRTRLLAATAILWGALSAHLAMGLVVWLAVAGRAALAALSRPGASGRSRATELVHPALALGLAAWFLVPLAQEIDWVRIRDPGQTLAYDETDFLEPLDLLLPTKPQDPLLANPEGRLGLGLAPVLLAAAGTAAGLRRARDRPLLIYVLGLTLLSAFLATPWAAPVWRVFRPLHWFQFPSRFLLISGVGLAAAAGLGLGPLTRRLSARGKALAALTLVTLAALPELSRLYPAAPYPALPSPTVSALHAFERSSGAWGTTSASEFLPRWIEGDRESLPDQWQAILEGQGYRTIEHHLSGPFSPTESFRVESDAGGGVLLPRLFYPGWEGALDGRPLELEPAAGNGLLTVELPPGQHEVILRYRGTPARWLGTAVSLASLAAVGALALRRRGGAGRSTRPVSQDAWADSAPPGWAWSAAGGGILLMLALKVAWVDPGTEWFRFPAALQGRLAVASPHRLRLQEGVELLGYSGPESAVERGSSVRVTLFWRDHVPGGPDFRTFVHLTRLEAPNEPLVVSDHRHPGLRYPFSRWGAPSYIRDRHELHLPPHLPTAGYVLRAGVYEPQTGRKLQKLGPDAGPYADLVDLGFLRVVPKEGQAAEHGLEPPVTFGDVLELEGYAIEEREGGAEIVLHWRSEAAPGSDWSIFVHVLDPEGRRIAQHDGYPVGGWYPTSRWAAGQRVIDVHPLSASLPQAGSLWIGVYDPLTGGRLPARQGDSALPDSAWAVPLNRR